MDHRRGGTRGVCCGSFNYILVHDKEVTMETEIGTLSNPRVQVQSFPLKLDE